MAYTCQHHRLLLECEACMGYVPPPRPAPLRLNVDRFGLAKDFATYMWLVYRRVVDDRSPERMAFLHGPYAEVGDFGQQIAMR